MSEHEQIAQKAIDYARANKKKIARDLTDTDKFPSEENPVSVFMAGSPGAGKTESSKNLIKRFSDQNNSVLRIDPDELRNYFEDYTGTNSFVFQSAVSILVSSIHDHALSNRQSFLIDGTLSSLKQAKENIQRSLDKKRFVQILYVYQDPIQAWDFTQKREALEGRNIPKEVFIEQYFAARETVNALKKQFGPTIRVDLLVKNIDGSDQYYKENIDIIDSYVEEIYNRETLKKVI